MDDAARSRLEFNVVSHLKKGLSVPVLTRAFEYWRNIDRNIGERIDRGVNVG
jgi:catalase